MKAIDSDVAGEIAQKLEFALFPQASDCPRMRNHHYWIHRSKTQFRPEIEVLTLVITEKILAAFDSIDEEADAVSKEVWDRFNEDTHSNADPANAAEKAEHAGLRHYHALADARQGLLNLFTVALHHSLEQQQITILRDELNSVGAPLTRDNLNTVEFQKRLAASGIMITSFRSWPDLDELRLVANVTKHAEGPSAQQLQLLRRDLFIPACMRNDSFLSKAGRWLFRPMSGEDLHVGRRDIERYFSAAEAFWCEFEEKLQSRTLLAQVF